MNNRILSWPLRVDLSWMGRTDFFPPPPKKLSELSSICIGTKTRTIGDALMLSRLPGILKARYPGLRVTTFTRGFNPVVFDQNPHVAGWEIFPSALYGDDCNSGSGQLIELKLNYFGCNALVEPPRPEIWLSDCEKQSMRRFVEERSFNDLPLCLIHPWGQTRKADAEREFWTSVVSTWRHRYRFWQVGIEGHSAIPGCEYYFLMRPRRVEARRLFALSSMAEAFIGVDSGPMHVAAAFGVRSLVITRQGSVAEIFERRRRLPYYAAGNWRNAFLYDYNSYLEADRLSLREMIGQAGQFLEAGT